MLWGRQAAVPTTGPLPRGGGASSLPAVAATGRQTALLILSILPLGGGTAGAEAQPLSPAGSRTETSLQEDRRCDSLASLPWLWLLQMSPPPGKSNWEMFHKPSYLNRSCLRQDQALTSFGEHIFVLSKHGARSLAKDTNRVQDKRSLSAILYETCLSLKRILRGVKQTYAEYSALYHSETLHSSGTTWVEDIPGQPWCY